jgi:hypothetical protein
MITTKAAPTRRESLEELLKRLYTACGCSNTDNLKRALTIHF